MLTSRRRVVAPVVSLALCLALGSCGGGGGEPEPPSEPPAQLLAEAVANPAQSGVATVQLNLSLEGTSPLAGASSVSLHGPFALDPAGGLPRFDFDLDAEVAGFGVDGSLVCTGDDAFVVFFGESYRIGAEAVAAFERELRTAAGSAAGSPAALGLRIDRWFRDPRYAGADDVSGTETERIEATLNSAAVARDLGELASAVGAPGLVAALARGAGSGPADAWVAFEDDTIRRLNVGFAFTVPPAQRGEANGITGGAVSLDAQISSVGTEEAIEPPPGGGFQPIERLIERLRDLASLGGI